MINGQFSLSSLRSPFVLLPSAVFDLGRIPGAARYSVSRLVITLAHLYSVASVTENQKVSMSYEELQNVLSLGSESKVHSVLAFLRERGILAGRLVDGSFTSLHLFPLPLLPKVLLRALPSLARTDSFFSYPVFLTVLPVDVYTKAVYLYLMSRLQQESIPSEIPIQDLKGVLKLRKKKIEGSISWLERWGFIKVRVSDSAIFLSALSLRWPKELLRKSRELYPEHLFFRIFAGGNNANAN
jgi:hypothetical protein